MNENIVITLSAVHLIAAIITIIVGAGVQVGLLIQWRRTTSLVLKEHELRLKELESGNTSEEKLLLEIKHNLMRLLEIHGMKYNEN